MATTMWVVATALSATAGYASPLRFTEVAAASGLDHRHGYTGRVLSAQQSVAGGVACGDFDGDGWPDLFVVCGAAGPHRLYRNLRDGRFQDVAGAVGLALDDSLACGPLFFDYDGDGWPDLFIGAIEGGSSRLFHNEGGEGFVDVTAGSGIAQAVSTVSATAADYDRDGDLDLFLGHWGSPPGACHLWRNLGAGRFECADASTGLDVLLISPADFTFTANFADLDGDERPDLLLTSDFGTSRVLLQQIDGRFRDAAGLRPDDENGMGSALGDVDGDGDLDWFVSSIWDPDGVAEGNWGTSGSRLYRNRGDGTFEDATEIAGVRRGYWGWGSVFADFDLDGDLDLFHVNGWPRGSPEFHSDPSRLFLGDGSGAFVEASDVCALADSGQGRGVVAFDYDRDGDIDLFVANNGGAPTLWRNEGTSGHWLEVALVAAGPNPAGVGARVELVTQRTRQVRLVRAGSNYVSQDPAEAHFGWGADDRIVSLRVRWPDGTSSGLADLSPDQRVILTEPAPSDAPGASPQARPNPFTDALDLQLAGRALRAGTIRVLDVRGRLVRTLLVSAGQRSVRWDGRDEEGMPVRAGNYWVQESWSRTPAVRVVRLR